mgnify:CR=1 FL=1
MLLQEPTTVFAAGWKPPAEMPFHWHVYDVASVLPAGWDIELLDLARREAVQHTFRPTMSTAREDPDAQIPLVTVNGEKLMTAAAWVHDLYTGWFRDLARRLTDEDLYTTSTLNRALSLNILRLGGDRYPCHVDSNPMLGLLYLPHLAESPGGGLVVGRDRTARNVAGVDADRAVIYPRRGQLYFFDARAHAHYVEPMRTDALRAVLTMNYYSPSCPETARPAGLDEQLFTPGGTRP